MTQKKSEFQGHISEKSLYNNIPKELRNLKQWVCFALESTEEGKQKKTPKNPFTGGNANTKHPNTWGSFEQVTKACEKYKFPLIGFVFTEGDPYSGVDIDNCVDNGNLSNLATETLNHFEGTYSEYSTSGTGIHILFKGSFPERGRKNPQLKLEIYTSGRFFIMTGNCIKNNPIIELQDQANSFYEKYFKKEEPKKQISSLPNMLNLSDQEIIEKASKARNGSAFSALMAGDISGYNDDSNTADLALCSHLVFWTQDKDQIDRIFRSSGLYRKKWERKDYRNRTLDKAINSCTSHYNPLGFNNQKNNIQKFNNESMKEQESNKKNKPEIEDSAKELEEMKNKARASARRRALMKKTTLQEITSELRKQYPLISDGINDIATRAIEWAEDYQPKCVVEVSGIPKTITDMESLDLRFAQLEAPANPCTIINRKDAQPLSDADFKKRLSGEVVVSGVDDKGQPKYVAASAYWSGNTHKHIYKNIVFTNQPVKDEDYNLFTTLGITPKEGGCDRIIDHLREVICSNDNQNFQALIKLLSWQLQNIGKPSRIIVILKSKQQQVGKGTLLSDILAKIYGPAGLFTSDLGKVLTRFNDTLRGKSFVCLDEALFAGDRKSADSIKSLATTTSIAVEGKGIPTVKMPAAFNFFLTTNHDDCAYIEETDARYWVLEVSPNRFGDTEYFRELYHEIDAGGVEDFMHYLLNYDVKDFLPWRDVPKDSESKDKMIRNSINPYDARKWIEACCSSQMVLGLKPTAKDLNLPWEPWVANTEYVNGVFAVAYAEWQKSIKSPIGAKPTQDNDFGELLTSVGFEQRRTGVQRFRKLPDSEECLKKVEKLMKKSGKYGRP